MFQNIVVPLDESELAERAIPIAARIARASGGSITLVYIVTLSSATALQSKELSIIPDEVIDAMYNRADTYLKQTARSDELSGIPVTTEVGSHDPAYAILSLAQAHGADLIVMCSHGYTGVKRWRLGSVAHKITHHSTIPVLLLRSDYSSSKLMGDIQGPVRVMVPLDGSAMAQEALEPAIFLSTAFSAPTPGALQLACVLPLSEQQVQAFTEKNQAIQDTRAYLSGLEQRLRQEDMAAKLGITESIVVNTDIAHALVELAEPRPDAGRTQHPDGCDLIAITTHGYGGLARWIMGSVTDRVLEATKLPMLIVRPQKRD